MGAHLQGGFGTAGDPSGAGEGHVARTCPLSQVDLSGSARPELDPRAFCLEAPQMHLLSGEGRKVCFKDRSEMAPGA